SYESLSPTSASSTERRLLLRPAVLARKDESLFSSDTRINKVYFHYPWSETDRVNIEIPDGLTPEQLPDDVTIDIGALNYRASFHRDGNTVVYERKLSVNGIVFDVDEYPTLKAFFDRVHQADQSVLSLKR
ncbi:MAG TPA: hypothetical protein VLZ81_01210, partial [Blastocatellia bacterium]|nr:hypothetical protein [Blastocatellia bacterium]